MGKYKVSTPASSAGVVRFMDVKTSNMQIEPQYILGIAVAIIITVTILRMLIS